MFKFKPSPEWLRWAAENEPDSGVLAAGGLMKPITEFEPELQAELIAKARNWRNQHLDHVTDLVSVADAEYPPSGSDAFRPELWKGAHWKWLQTVRPI